MNQVKITSDKYMDVAEINGHAFMVAKEIISYDKNLNPAYMYSVKVSPEYNPSAGYTIKARSLKSLKSTIEKSNYKIVPVKG